MELLKDLGLNPQIAAKLAMKLHAHSVQYAYRYATRPAFEKIYVTSHRQGQEWGTTSQPPDPHSLVLFLLCWWRDLTVPRS